ncbi:MAG: hypothetical protein R2705_12845 [Ilumatobacteraceae bacterium]
MSGPTGPVSVEPPVPVCVEVLPVPASWAAPATARRGPRRRRSG